MCTDLLQAFQILTQFVLHSVCQHLRIFAIDDIALTIEEPRRNFVLCRALDDGDDAFEFFRCDFTGATIQTSILDLQMPGLVFF